MHQLQLSDDDIQARLEEANSRALELISIAEGLFGRMSSNWTYDGVVFYDHPPHLNYSPDTATVQIWLSLRAIDDDIQRDFQLAHEVCHLLYPSVNLVNPSEPQTNVINEGISTYFSVIAVGLFQGDDAAIGAEESLALNSPTNSIGSGLNTVRLDIFSIYFSWGDWQRCKQLRREICSHVPRVRADVTGVGRIAPLEHTRIMQPFTRHTL